MTLAQVQGVVAGAVALIITWASLLMAVALLMPERTNRAEAVLETSPKRCFVNGLLCLVIAAVGLRLLQTPAPLIKLAGAVVLLGLGALLTVGAAALAQLMGRRIGEMSGARTSLGTLVRGSLIYSFALGFPLIGWYLFLPLSTLCALGAGAVAFKPARKHRNAPAMPALEGQGAA